MLVTRYIEEMREPVRTPFDLLGLILAGTALASLMFGIEMVSRGVGSGAITFGLVGAGVVSAGFYVLHARHHAHPMLDFRMMRIPTFPDFRCFAGRCRASPWAPCRSCCR